MVKIFCCLGAVWLLMSCATEPPSGNDGSQGFGGNSIPWPANWPKEGFLEPHESHAYGFDISPNFPNAIKDREDSIAYISTPTNGKGYVKVFTDTGYATDYDYYYCDPNTLNRLEELPSILAKEFKEHRLEVGISSIEKIALCRSFLGKAYKVNELHNKAYDLKDDYSFYAYSWGDRSKPHPRHQMINEKSFWHEFNAVYRQAIVGHGNVNMEFSEPEYYYIGNEKEKIEYILSRARGDYDEDCIKGEIDKFIDEIQYDGGLEGEKRVIIQLGYPVKNFWPLKSQGGRIEICGSRFRYDDPKSKNTLILVPISPEDNKDCEALDARVKWDNPQNAWVLIFPNSSTEIATTSNVDPNCAVFMDTATPDSPAYIGEIPINSVAVANTNGGATVVILPWVNDADVTKRVAYHELGHAMGLTDVLDNLLSDKITQNTNQGNLMHSNSSWKGIRLRNRGMVPSEPNERNGPCKNKLGGYCVELQWDCLHKESGACLLPDLDPYFR